MYVSLDTHRHDYIGYVDFVVGDLVTSNGQKLAIAIKNKRGQKLKKVNGMAPIAIIRS